MELQLKLAHLRGAYRMHTSKVIVATFSPEAVTFPCNAKHTMRMTPTTMKFSDPAPAIVDLPFLSANFPLPSPAGEVLRENIVNTLTNLASQSVHAAAIEGVEGIGKTTILSQFVRRHNTVAISIFVTAANRLSYDPELIRADINVQVHWILTDEVLDRSRSDPALLKSYYADLQRVAKQRKGNFYFVIDGVEELDGRDRNNLLQALSDVLPIGTPQFRFLFSGDESLYRPLFNPRLTFKSFPLPEFSVDETRTLFASYALTPETASELNGICRGLPGRLSEVLRGLESNVISLDFIQDPATRWPEFFEIDWRQVNPQDNTLNRILALVSQDLRPHTVKDVAATFDIDESEVVNRLSTVNFVSIEPQTAQVRFANTALQKFVANRLQDRKLQVQKLLIKRLMRAPDETEAIVALPEYLEEAAEYSDLLNLLTPDHILQILQRSQTLSRLDSTVKRGRRSATKLGRDADVLRFGLQESIIAELASANVWESEVAALAALHRDPEALALANNAVLREDRLLMLATLTHHVWVRGDDVPSEVLEQIRLLVDNLDFLSLGRRAEEVAAKLTCVDPELAGLVLKKARWADDESLDRTFARLTVSALRDLKDHRRRDKAIESAAKSREDPRARGLLEGARVLAGRLTPGDVCDRSVHIQDPEARVSVLRYWCLLNGSTPGADLVAAHALRLSLATPTITLDADLLADIASALPGAVEIERRKSLIAELDGLRGTAERLGPSVDYVKLQLTIALAEADFDGQAAEGRLIELLDYVARIGDLPAKGEAYARFLSAIKLLSSRLKLASGEMLEGQCASELESVVLLLSASTADQHFAMGGIIEGLALGDLDKALDYVKVLNTEARRDAVLVDALGPLLDRPITDIDPSALLFVVGKITAKDKRDDALGLILQRFANETSLPHSAVRALAKPMSMLPEISDSMEACRALVSALSILEKASLKELEPLTVQIRSSVQRRWSCIDIGWARIDAGFGIARDLAGVNPDEANRILNETEAMKAESQIPAHRSASTYVACVRLALRVACGLLPRRLETASDLSALATLIEVVPSYGERAVLWADLCMRAMLLDRLDLAERLVNERVLPCFEAISMEDKAYRARVLIQIGPAVHRVQPTRTQTEIEGLDPNYRDYALREVIRFLLTHRVPSDPIDRTADLAVETSFETLRQVHELVAQLGTDWMVYAATEDVADSVTSLKNKQTITVPQKEDLARRFIETARSKLPMNRHITHIGFRIATVAQALRMRQTKPQEWTDLIQEAEKLENVADRVYVMQILALCLPKGMLPQSQKLLDAAREQIAAIPWHMDQIERYLGMAEELQGVDTVACRDLVSRAALAMASSSEDVREQRRRLVDVAYRVDEALAKKLVNGFDDDEAKRSAQRQMRLLEVRKTIIDEQGAQDQDRSLKQIESRDVSRLGLMLVRALNAGRVQTFHPSDVRHYLELAAAQPLERSYSLIVWYIDNAVTRYSKTEQAASFLRPMFDACVVGAQLAGQIAGRTLIRLRALKEQSTELSGAKSLFVRPGTREDAIRAMTAWFERQLGSEVIIQDPYFQPEDLEWIQRIRTAKRDCAITVVTARVNQPTPGSGEELEDLYAAAWQRKYDQAPPKAEIAVIGGEKTKKSPLHDRWILTDGSGLRLGTSLNSLGVTKDSEISEMSPEQTDQKKREISAYLTRERADYNGEKLRLIRFWL